MSTKKNLEDINVTIDEAKGEVSIDTTVEELPIDAVKELVNGLYETIVTQWSERLHKIIKVQEELNSHNNIDAVHYKRLMFMYMAVDIFLLVLLLIRSRG